MESRLSSADQSEFVEVLPVFVWGLDALTEQVACGSIWDRPGPAKAMPASVADAARHRFRPRG